MADGLDRPHGPGKLEWRRADENPDLLAGPVNSALAGLDFAAEVLVAEIDPELADTAAFCERYGVTFEQSANCVVVAGKRAGQTSYAAGLLLANCRLDVNGVVRARLGARKASFAPLAEAVELSGMEYGGITPIGVPGWPVLIDSRVADAAMVVIGSGLRTSKIALPASRLAQLPGAEIVPGLAAMVQ